MRALIAIDLLDPQLDSLIAEATRHAERMQCTLDVLYAESLPYMEGFISDVTVAAMLQKEAESVRKQHAKRLQALVDGLPEAVRGTAITVIDSPTEVAIVDTSADYDLLIIGTHGRTGFAHFMLGSVAERVIRRATVPTLVLREHTPG